MFAVEVECRTAAVLQRIIEDHVAEGSIIHTDCWKGYSYLEDSPNLSQSYSQSYKKLQRPHLRMPH